MAPPTATFASDSNLSCAPPPNLWYHRRRCWQQRASCGSTVMQLVIASESLGKERGGPTWRRHYETACAVYSSPIALGKDLAQVRLLLLLAPQPLACLLACYFASLLEACYISQSHKLCKSPMRNRIRGTLDDLNFLDALAEKGKNERFPTYQMTSAARSKTTPEKC